MSVQITGGDEAVAYFNRLARDLEPLVLVPATRDWATALRDAMIKREHFRSGRMRSMTKVNTLGRYWSVIVAVPYAETENQRRGNKRGKKGGGQGTPHRFVEPAMREVEPSQRNNLLNKLSAFIGST